MSRTLRILIISLAVLLSCGTACAQTPDCVEGFKKVVSCTRYLRDQDSLKLLLLTRRGNCLAHAKFGALVAARHGLRCEMVKVQRGTVAHMLAVVHVGRQLWCVSNRDIYLISSVDETVKWSSESGWKIVVRRDSMAEELD